jgi:hypothetical protein
VSAGVALSLGLVDEQGDQVVAPARRGACCWLRTTRPPPAGADIEKAPIARWGGVGGPVVLSQGAHARMGVPVGEGFARPRSGRSRDVRPWPPLCRFRPRLRSSERARTARSLLVPSERATPRLSDVR